MFISSLSRPLKLNLMVLRIHRWPYPCYDIVSFYLGTPYLQRYVYTLVTGTLRSDYFVSHMEFGGWKV
ncbi:hypothetical protein ONZ45_g5233 [Pleurotus djamor]|nr:hypothetical protein ONZ45_g5233 [Pleurotus djamor]